MSDFECGPEKASCTSRMRFRTSTTVAQRKRGVLYAPACDRWRGVDHEVPGDRHGYRDKNKRRSCEVLSGIATSWAGGC